MRLTVNELRRIIKEEVTRTLGEAAKATNKKGTDASEAIEVVKHLLSNKRNLTIDKVAGALAPFKPRGDKELSDSDLSSRVGSVIFQITGDFFLGGPGWGGHYKSEQEIKEDIIELLQKLQYDLKSKKGERSLRGRERG